MQIDTANIQGISIQLRSFMREGSEYETVKAISTEMQSTFWYKHQYAQGNSIQCYGSKS
jgi:hypothetical protein